MRGDRNRWRGGCLFISLSINLKSELNQTKIKGVFLTNIRIEKAKDLITESMPISRLLQTNLRSENLLEIHLLSILVNRSHSPSLKET